MRLFIKKERANAAVDKSGKQLVKCSWYFEPKLQLPHNYLLYVCMHTLKLISFQLGTGN